MDTNVLNQELVVSETSYPRRQFPFPERSIRRWLLMNQAISARYTIRQTNRQLNAEALDDHCAKNFPEKLK